jgi:hypothetical protein
VIADGERSCWERARWFGENILYWLLTIACNPAAGRLNKFWRSRTSIYLSRIILEANTYRELGSIHRAHADE